MGWKSVLFGFAAVVALTLGSWGQTASAPADAPPLRLSNSQSRQYQAPVRIQGQPAPVEQPRYATMIPPGSDESIPVNPPAAAQTPAPASPPIAAPTTPVTASPADASAAPRYATMAQPKPIEQITVTGLRQSQDGQYRLGAGDKLRITVFNEGDLSGEFAVDGQGFVRLPLVGQLPAAGLTTYALESRIADAFVNGGFLVNPRVSVEIMNYRPFYIIGEVAKPGEYAYVNAMSAPNAIALAGGYTDRAVESTVWVRHQGEAKEHELAADETTRIQPGDVIRVSRTTYWSIMTLLAPIISPFTSIAYLLK